MAEGAGPIRAAPPARRTRLRILAGLPPWILWVLCILLVTPVLINVPGDPEPWERWLYFAVLAAVTFYPILLPVFAGFEKRARRRNEVGKARTFRRAIWVIFGLAAGVVVALAAVMYANQPPPMRAEQRIEEELSTAIAAHDLDALRRLVEGGVDVEFPLFGDGTPATLAGLHQAWPLLLYLIEKGADPDKATMTGWTARSLLDEAPPPPGEGDDARAYRRLREMLGSPGQGSAPPAG
ncbi:hypothetical protein [Antarcticirhabdus aurantiaca]|uniref:Uncharacterized protein n=1 Tax=Antarcticirhabdus aurantiaca TaxID=2606717 RepID=A0ACD4NRT0_9HYPH|nr:hypothetical protein [Antarcticirhabdus aurantiaca]WAJ29646.1 hypothetical protein OXU80_05290 [Jeongeuplla avenae]